VDGQQDRQPASHRDIYACCGVLLQYKFGQELHRVVFTSTHNWGANKTPDAIVGGGTSLPKTPSVFFALVVHVDRELAMGFAE
jgi:hypothetical protein